MKRHIFGVFVLLVLFVLPAHTAAGQDLLPKGKWWKHPEVLEKVDLSDEQIQRIEAISDEGMRRIIRLEADFRIARMDLENLLDQIDQQTGCLDDLLKKALPPCPGGRAFLHCAGQGGPGTGIRHGYRCPRLPSWLSPLRRRSH